MFDTDYLIRHYTPANGEGRSEDDRLTTRHGSVEFVTTMRYIEKYLFPGARVLEIVAGTGRYSHALAQKGYGVDAVELVPYNIEIFRRKISADEIITITQGDARDLSAFTDESYDITLLLGPLYHMFTIEDKRQTIGEALRVTKTGGVVFAAYCMSDASIMEGGFKNNRFDMELCLRKFAEHYAEIFNASDAIFLEKYGRLLFLSYLKPLINGDGFYHIESQFTDMRRMDIVVDFGRDQFIVELKIWRGEKYEEDAYKQLTGYLDTKKADRGYLLIFDFRNEINKTRKTEWAEIYGKKIFEVIL